MKDFKWKWQDTLIVILGVLSLGYALVNYSKLPDQLPAQFSITGKVNTYWSKNSLLVMSTVMGLVFPLGMQFARNIDPKKDNYSRFVNAYKMIRLAIAVLFDGMLVLSVSYGLNQQLPAGKIGIAAVGLLFIVLGNYMPQIKDNYLIGIRTPWTLDSPEVWRKTHRLSGFLWVVGGLLIAMGAFMPKALSIGLIIAALFVTLAVPFIYSWLVSRRLKA